MKRDKQTRILELEARIQAEKNMLKRVLLEVELWVLMRELEK